MTARERVPAFEDSLLVVADVPGRHPYDIVHEYQHPGETERVRPVFPGEFARYGFDLYVTRVRVYRDDEFGFRRTALLCLTDPLPPSRWEMKPPQDEEKDDISLCDPNLEEVVCRRDHEWFEARPDEVLRVRSYIPGEFGDFREPEEVFSEAWFSGEVIVVRLNPGQHVKYPKEFPACVSLDQVPEAWDDGEDDNA